MKRIVCTLLLVLFVFAPSVYAQIGSFKLVVSDTVRAKDYRFIQLPNYSVYGALTTITAGDQNLSTPPGNTASRPTVPAGKYILRYNTDSSALEIGNPSQVWKTLGQSSVQSFDTSSISNFGLKVRGTLSGTTPILYNGVTGNISIQQSNASQAGYLSQADWIAFNEKLPDPGSNGILVRTALGITASRQLVAASTNVSIVNPNGVSGNPSLDINDTLLLRQLQLPYLPAAAPYADSVLYLNRSTGFLEIRPVPSGGGGGTFNKAGGGISFSGDSLYIDQSFTRGLFSANAPVTYNSSTGVFGVDTTTNGTGLVTLHKFRLVNNGLSMNSDTTQFGQAVGASGNPAALNHTTEVPMNGFGLVYTGTGGLAIGTTVVGNRKLNIAATSTIQGINISTVDGTGINVVSSGTAGALFAQAAGTGNAITGSNAGSSGYGILASSSNNGTIPLKANVFSTLTNSATPVVTEFVRNVFGVPADGVGLSLMFRGQTTNTTDVETGQIRNYLSTALHASRSSAFEFHLINNTVSARKALLASTGQWTWDGYPTLSAQTDTTAYKPIGIDGSGNVVKMSTWIGGGGGTPGSPLNSIQFNNAGAFGGDSLQYYPVENKLLTSQDYIQYGRPVTGHFQDSSSLFASGYLWMVFPRGSNGMPGQAIDPSWGGDSTQPWYANQGSVVYDINQPPNSAINFVAFGTTGNYRPMFRFAVEQNYYNTTEVHLATKPRIMNPNDEIRHWSWTIDQISGDARLDTRATAVQYSWSDVGPDFDRPFLGIGANGVLSQTWGVNGTMSVTHGNSAAAKTIGMVVDTASAGVGVGAFYVSANTPVLYIGSAAGATAIDIENPATTGGVISVHKPINTFGKYIQVNNLANNAIAHQVISSSVGVMWKLSATATGYSDMYNEGTISINRDPLGFSLSDRMFSIYNNLNPNDSIFHVRANGDIYTKGMVTANADSTTGATGGFVYRDAATGNFRITAGSGGGGGMAIGAAVTSSTSGSILFADGSSNLAQDNANLFWDNTNDRLGIGTTTPTRKLDVAGRVRLTYVGNNEALEIFGTDRVIGSGGAGHIGFQTDFVSFGTAAIATPPQLAKVYIEGGSSIAGTSSLKVDSGALMTTPEKYAIENNGDHFYWTDRAGTRWQLDQQGGSATTLYNGNGTLSGNRTVTGSNNSLTFNGVFNYRINGNSFILDKSTPVAPYSMGVAGAPNDLLIGYTPVPTVYSKGVGVTIDTNNNVSLGGGSPIGTPLYSAGTSTSVAGFQSAASNFYLVENVTTNITANLMDHYFRIDATSGNITITLPAASTAFGASVGINYVFKRIDNSGNTVTINRAGSDTIDGATSLSLTTQYQVKEIICSSTSTWDVRQP